MNDLINFSKIAYGLAGKRLLILIGLAALAGIFEGLGVSLFLPLLLGVKSDNTLNNLLIQGFSFAHVPYTFRSVLLFMVIFFFLRSAILIFKEIQTGKIISYLLVDLRCRLTSNLFDANYQFWLQKEQGYINNAVLREFELLILAFKNYASILISVRFYLGFRKCFGCCCASRSWCLDACVCLLCLPLVSASCVCLLCLRPGPADFVRV